MTDFVGIIRIPLTTNPLSLNARMHWSQKARHTKKWRAFAAQEAAGFPELGACDVTLTWFVKTNHRRDIDNLFGLLKALADGIVDAKVVPDDTPNYMTKTCDIQPAPTHEPIAYMELKVENR